MDGAFGLGLGTGQLAALVAVLISRLNFRPSSSLRLSSCLARLPARAPAAEWRVGLATKAAAAAAAAEATEVALARLLAATGGVLLLIAVGGSLD